MLESLECIKKLELCFKNKRMKDQNSEEINEGNIPALLGSKLFVFFVFTKSWVANALKSSVLMNEYTYYTFDIDTTLHS